MLFVSKQGPESRRVFVIEKDSNLKYITYYYILENNMVLEPHMEHARRYIDE